jgi:hypothetical protein
MLDTFRKHPVIAVAVVCMLVFFGVMMSPPTAHQKLKNAEVKSLTNARKICLACRDYSRAHAGNFPPTFDTLFPQYLQDRGMLASPLSPGDAVGYTYMPPPVAKVDSPDTIVIEDKYAPALMGHRVVVYANGSARILVPPGATP